MGNPARFSRQMPWFACYKERNGPCGPDPAATNCASRGECRLQKRALSGEGRARMIISDPRGSGLCFLPARQPVRIAHLR